MIAMLRTSLRAGRAVASAVVDESRGGEAVLMTGARHTRPRAPAQGPGSVARASGPSGTVLFTRFRAFFGIIAVTVTSADIEALGRLSPSERGVVVGLTVGGVRGVDPLQGAACVAGAAGDACRAALRALAGLPRDE